MFDLELQARMNIHGVFTPAWKIPKQPGETGERGWTIRECAILDIINRMRRHVSDNRMILNSPASLFRVTPSLPREPRAEFQTQCTGNFLFYPRREQPAPFTFSFVIESTLENRGKHRTGFSPFFSFSFSLRRNRRRWEKSGPWTRWFNTTILFRCPDKFLLRLSGEKFAR